MELTITMFYLCLSLWLSARDVVATFVKQDINNTNHFEWLRQLRYYWVNGDVTIKMITTEMTYGYEYLGEYGGGKMWPFHHLVPIQ